jgi:hypothetical protein
MLWFALRIQVTKLFLKGDEIMAGKETKLSIWSLDADINLEQIPRILGLDYSKDIDYLDEVDNPNLTEFDKKLMHRWREYKPDQGFEIETLEILGTTIRCISAYAYLESPAPKNQAIFGNFVVPRAQRVSHTQLPVFFFELSGRVYVIVTGPEYKTRYIRSMLMGGGRTPDESHTVWKTVQFKDIPNYTFSSEFFYWLISKENSIINTSFFNMNVSDIRYLAQSPDRRDVHHESKGDNLLDEAMSKTGLGVNSRVGQVGTTISTTEGTLRFVLFETGDCYVDNYESAVHSSSGEIEPFELHLEIGAIMLHGILLPAMKSAFNAEKNSQQWTTQHQAESRKTWALGAINELCSENDISIQDIQFLDWFK